MEILWNVNNSPYSLLEFYFFSQEIFAKRGYNDCIIVKGRKSLQRNSVFQTQLNWCKYELTAILLQAQTKGRFDQTKKSWHRKQRDTYKATTGKELLVFSGDGRGKSSALFFQMLWPMVGWIYASVCSNYKTSWVTQTGVEGRRGKK